MNYLYALMGMAMLSGIISIMEIASSVKTRDLSGIYIEDSYSNIESLAPEMDRLILELLYTKADSEWPKGTEFCQKLKNEAIKVSTIASEYIVDEESISDHPKLLNTCTISSSKHRIILSNEYSEKLNYRLFSCMTYKDNFCFYEK